MAKIEHFLDMIEVNGHSNSKMETIKNFLHEINILKGLERTRTPKEYRWYHEVIAYKDNEFKSSKVEEIVVEMLRENLKDFDSKSIGALLLQCPELLPDIVEKKHRGIEEVREICTSLQTNDPKELSVILRNKRLLNKDRKKNSTKPFRRSVKAFIEKAQKIEFEKMYVFDRSDKEDRLRAAIRVSEEVIKEYIHRSFLGREEEEQRNILYSLKNPDSFFIETFLNWSGEYLKPGKGAGQMEGFYTAHSNRFSEKMHQEMIQNIKDRRDSNWKTEDKRELLSINIPKQASMWFEPVESAGPTAAKELREELENHPELNKILLDIERKEEEEKNAVIWAIMMALEAEKNNLVPVQNLALEFMKWLPALKARSA